MKILLLGMEYVLVFVLEKAMHIIQIKLVNIMIMLPILQLVQVITMRIGHRELVLSSVPMAPIQISIQNIVSIFVKDHITLILSFVNVSSIVQLIFTNCL